MEPQWNKQSDVRKAAEILGTWYYVEKNDDKSETLTSKGASGSAWFGQGLRASSGAMNSEVGTDLGQFKIKLKAFFTCK